MNALRQDLMNTIWVLLCKHMLSIDCLYVQNSKTHLGNSILKNTFDISPFT